VKAALESADDYWFQQWQMTLELTVTVEGTLNKRFYR